MHIYAFAHLRSLRSEAERQANFYRGKHVGDLADMWSQIAAAAHAALQDQEAVEILVSPFSIENTNIKPCE